MASSDDVELPMPLQLADLLVPVPSTPSPIPAHFRVDPANRQRAEPPSTAPSPSWVDGPSSSAYSAVVASLASFAALPHPARNALTQSVTDGVAHALRNPTRNRLTLAAFIVTTLALEGERSNERPPSQRGSDGTRAVQRAKTGWAETGRVDVMNAMVAMVEKDVAGAWVGGVVPGEYGWAFASTSLQLLECMSFAKDKTVATGPLLRVLVACVTTYGQAPGVATTLMRLMNKYEHLSVLLADILSRMDTKHGCRAFVNDVVRELAKIDSGELSQDNAGARCTSNCLVEISDRLPEVILENLTALAVHMDGEAYLLRNAIVHAFANVVLHQTEALKKVKREKAETGDADPNRCQVEEEAVRPEAILRVIDSIFETLLERVHDRSPFTRARVLAEWRRLMENDAVPLRLVYPLSLSAYERLSDRTSIARRGAMLLWGQILRSNPFGPSLSLCHFESKLQSMPPSPASRDSDDGEQEVSQTSNSMSSNENELRTFYLKAVEFIKLVERVVHSLQKLLRSTLPTDITQSIQLLVITLKFQVDGAGPMTRRMLELVLCGDENVRQAVVAAYAELIRPPNFETISPQDQAVGIARSLIGLAANSSVGDLTCLESLIGELSKLEGNIFSSAVVQVIWDVFSAKVPGATTERRRGACQLISMISYIRPETTWSRLGILCAVVFDPRDDSVLLRWSCVALEKAASSKRPGVGPLRLPSNHAIVLGIAEFFRSSDTIPTAVWIPTAEQALNTVYGVCEEPEHIIESILEAILANFSILDSEIAVIQKCPLAPLQRLVFTVGHVALRQLVHTEAKLVALRDQPEKKRSRRKSMLMGQAEPADNLENELGINGAEEERDAEAALHNAELEISSQDSMLGRFIPLVSKLASNPALPGSLQTLAALSLAKFMCIEEECCRRHLPLLFAILEKSANPSLRSNTIIALGDLCFRFPNLIEPWTKRLYWCLDDGVPRVRKNALMAITHLILNGMIKVKGHVASIAVRVTDSEPRIAELTKVFFKELKQKNPNAIYNILPDIISCLSEDETNVEQSVFRVVMDFLGGFISKDVHAEGVVEKLCQRFSTTDRVADHTNLAFCISILPSSDRLVRRLIDQFKCYSAALEDSEVASLFLDTLRKAKRTNKADMKESLAELEEQLRTALNEERSSKEVEQLSHQVNSLALEKPRSQPQSTMKMNAVQDAIQNEGRRDRQDKSRREDATDDQASAEKENRSILSKRSRGTGRRQTLRRIPEDESSDESSEEFMFMTKRRVALRERRPRHIVGSSDSDSD